MEGHHKAVRVLLPAILVGFAVLGLARQAAAGPLAWEEEGYKREAWSEKLRQQIKDVLPAFDGASDVGAFCDNYAKLNTDERIEVWATMAVKIAWFESEYDPSLKTKEPAPLHYYSIGLYQLSYQDHMSWCPTDSQSSALTNPLINIRCAIPMMAKLIDRDGVIASGHKGQARGIARYWSTMRRDRHLSAVIAATRKLDICQ